MRLIILCAATEERTDPHHITSLKRFKSTISQTIDRDRSSMCLAQRPILGVLYLPFLPRFQKAIKKVRAVQRMRKNRGFAFSQTEDVGRQDQAKLIRAYDTSTARPSGY
jgi:hypothetical protein